MDDFLPAARQAFRVRLGLPPESGSVAAPDSPERLFAWARRHRLTGLLASIAADSDGALQTAAYGLAQHAARYRKQQGGIGAAADDSGHASHAGAAHQA